MCLRASRYPRVVDSLCAAALLSVVAGLAGCGARIQPPTPEGPADSGPAPVPAIDSGADASPPSNPPVPVPCTKAPAVETLASEQALLGGLAVNDSSAFWDVGVAPTVVTSVPKAGGSTAPVYMGAAIAVADDKDVIVITGAGNASDFGLVRVPRDGSSPTTLVSGVPVISAVAMDATTVFWSTPNTVGDNCTSCPVSAPPQILSIPRAGGTVTTVLDGVDALALQLDETDVYWATQVAGDVPSPQTSIGRVPKAGGVAVALVSLPDFVVTDFKIDGTTIYWGQSSLFDTAPTTLVSVAKSGGTPITLATLTYPARPQPLALDGASVYWRDASMHAVVKVAKAGGAVVSVAPDGVSKGGSGGLVVDDTGVYWTANTECGVTCTGTVLHVAPACP